MSDAPAPAPRGTARPYGSWPSPIAPEDLAAASPRFDGARFVGDEIWWAQSVPEEKGRMAVLRRDAAGAVRSILPAPWNARSSVHEYGGGAWTATDEGVLIFVHKDDQRVRALSPGGAPRALTPEEPGTRYGGLAPAGPGAVLAVREREGEGAVPERAIVRIEVAGAPGVTELAAGSDFVAQPALSPDGERLAWIAWDHPDMPWDHTTLRVRFLRDASAPVITVAGAGGTAPLQPVWTGPDELVYADDPDGRWNLYRGRVLARMAPLPLAPADADTGGPLWVLGLRAFGVLGDGRILAVRTNGADELVVIDPGTGAVDPALGADAPALTADLNIEHTEGTRALVTGAGADRPLGLWLVDVAAGTAEAIAGGSSPWRAEWMPRPRAVTYPGPHGAVHAFAYAPTNPRRSAPEGELPPYVVLVHGGPTGHVGASPSAKIAALTSRGIGVLDVNYGGSSGYGRAYRERLKGQWGIVDVDDVAAAVEGLIAEGAADPARIAISGGSAGGWTVLSALTRTDVFAAGISRYGVGDARALAEGTHDFEARYLDGLIGPLPKADELYRERSPLSHPERFRAPVLLLQGSEDRVVPPAQSEAVRDALKVRGIPHAYRLYEGEGHGFRARETIIDVARAELSFLGQVFGFESDGIDPIALS